MCSVGGRTPRERHSTVLISDAIPAAHLVCPIWLFTEPSAQLCTPAPSNTVCIESSSVRSPTTVPVPCASMIPTFAGSTCACTYARSSARTWPSLRGGVRPSDLPSELPAMPLITAWIVSPSRCASDRRLRITTPTPSPSVMPSAVASNERQRPFFDSACTDENSR